MKMGNAAAYSLNVWMCTIFISPIFLLGFSGLYFAAALYGILYSLPFLALFIVIAFLLNRTTINILLKKSVMAALGVLSIYAALHLLDDGQLYSHKLFGIYCAIMVPAAFLFNLNPPPKKTKEELTETKN